MAAALDVYLADTLVGRLALDEKAEMGFVYAGTWRERPDAVALSYSLPLRAEPFSQRACAGYFAGLLSNGDARRGSGGNRGNDLAMLEQLGGDCPGAVSFLPPGTPPSRAKERYRVLAEEDLAVFLRDRLALDDSQAKIAVRLDGGKIGLPLAGAASSHILKPAFTSAAHHLYNEALCQALAAQVGLPAVRTIIGRVADVDYLLVARSDRCIDDTGRLYRLPQEDFCQALGYLPRISDKNATGRSTKNCFSLLRAASSLPVLDLGALLDALIFNLIIGNLDAHMRNFALRYCATNGTGLAPFHDLVAGVFNQQRDGNMAMKIGGEAQFDRVAPEHFQTLAGEANLAKPLVTRRVPEFARIVLAAIHRVDKPTQYSEQVAAFIVTRCRRVIARFEDG